MPPQPEPVVEEEKPPVEEPPAVEPQPAAVAQQSDVEMKPSEATHYTENSHKVEDEYSEETAVASSDYKEPAAPGTEDMEAEDEQQGEFQVMDSVGGDSEQPEADQGKYSGSPETQSGLTPSNATDELQEDPQPLRFPANSCTVCFVKNIQC